MSFDDDIAEDSRPDMVAYHEAGHAVIGWLLGLQVTQCKVGNFTDEEQRKIRGVLGLVYTSDDDSVYNAEASFLVSLAGVVAEYKAGNVFVELHGGDLKHVSATGKKYLPKNAKVSTFVKKFGIPFVAFLVDLHWDLIEALAKRLDEVVCMDGPQVDVFIREHQIAKMKQLDLGPIFHDDKIPS